jgi:hypothetical protein
MLTAGFASGKGGGGAAFFCASVEIGNSAGIANSAAVAAQPARFPVAPHTFSILLPFFAPYPLQSNRKTTAAQKSAVPYTI